MQDAINAVVELLSTDEKLAIIWPVHLNPVVKDAVMQAHSAANLRIQARWRLTQPLHYPVLIDLMRTCDVLLTDSGGVQEEAVARKKPVLILRNVTERPEVVQCGLGRLVGTDTRAVVSATKKILEAKTVQLFHPFENPFGDGTTGLKTPRHCAAALRTDQHDHALHKN